MSAPGKCPLCHAPLLGSYYDCGTHLSDKEPSRICKLRAALAETKRELQAAQKEADILRGLLPKLDVPCVYCGETEISKCKRGFPGCPQADDLLAADTSIHDSILDRLRKAESRVLELEKEVTEALELALDQCGAERLSGNIVKEEYWKGELAAIRRMKQALGEAMPAQEGGQS